MIPKISSITKYGRFITFTILFYSLTIGEYMLLAPWYAKIQGTNVPTVIISLYALGSGVAKIFLPYFKNVKGSTISLWLTITVTIAPLFYMLTIIGVIEPKMFVYTRMVIYLFINTLITLFYVNYDNYLASERTKEFKEISLTSKSVYGVATLVFSGIATAIYYFNDTAGFVMAGVLSCSVSVIALYNYRNYWYKMQ